MPLMVSFARAAGRRRLRAETAERRQAASITASPGWVDGQGEIRETAHL